MPPAVRGFVQQLGIPIVDTTQRSLAYLKEKGHKHYVGSPLTLSAEDPHPTLLVHGFWADAVFERLNELKWLPK